MGIETILEKAESFALIGTDILGSAGCFCIGGLHGIGDSITNSPTGYTHNLLNYGPIIGMGTIDFTAAFLWGSIATTMKLTAQSNGIALAGNEKYKLFGLGLCAGAVAGTLGGGKGAALAGGAICLGYVCGHAIGNLIK